MYKQCDGSRRGVDNSIVNHPNFAGYMNSVEEYMDLIPPDEREEEYTKIQDFLFSKVKRFKQDGLSLEEAVKTAITTSEPSELVGLLMSRPVRVAYPKRMDSQYVITASSFSVVPLGYAVGPLWLILRGAYLVPVATIMALLSVFLVPIIIGWLFGRSSLTTTPPRYDSFEKILRWFIPFSLAVQSAYFFSLIEAYFTSPANKAVIFECGGLCSATSLPWIFDTTWILGVPIYMCHGFMVGLSLFWMAAWASNKAFSNQPLKTVI